MRDRWKPISLALQIIGEREDRNLLHGQQIIRVTAKSGFHIRLFLAKGPV
jgi:hypothetical protein